jgi:5'-nucleotidase / UDP-sugar diphosphatase
MSRIATTALLALWLLLLAACTGEKANQATREPVVPPGGLRATATPATGLAGDEKAADRGRPVTITIFYTNDEHGWMEGMQPGEGAASMMAHWREAGYDPDGPYLALSGGDMWTGPAISTWFEGEGMVEVMNAMGYAAAAVGNHEFDFGMEALRARALESNFPFLSANLKATDGWMLAEWGILPYTVVDVAGVQVGIIGLTTQRTLTSTNPANLVGLDFRDYEEVLREIVPQVRAEGAELLLVVGHLCEAELVSLAQVVGDLGIALLGGGHCNERVAREVNGIILVEGGYHFTSYAAVELTYEPAAGALVEATYEVVPNRPAANPDAAVAAVVARWRELADAELELVIGYSERGLARHSTELHRLVPASWLLAFPEADVALTNSGGFRAGLPAGPLTFADVVGVLPFNNVLIDVSLTGEQLVQVLTFREADVAGVRRQGTTWLLADGTAIDPAGRYRLITTDFLYAGGDGYDLLARFDPDAYNTAVDWRQPLIDWIRAQQSDEARPLDGAFAELSRP